MEKLNGNVNNLIRTAVLQHTEWCRFCVTKHRNISWWLIREYSAAINDNTSMVNVRSYYFCSRECYIMYCLGVI